MPAEENSSGLTEYKLEAIKFAKKVKESQELQKINVGRTRIRKRQSAKVKLQAGDS